MSHFMGLTIRQTHIHWFQELKAGISQPFDISDIFCQMCLAIRQDIKFIRNINNVPIKMVGDQKPFIVLFFQHQFLYLFYLHGHKMRKRLIQQRKPGRGADNDVNIDQSSFPTGKILDTGLMGSVELREPLNQIPVFQLEILENSL